MSLHSSVRIVHVLADLLQLVPPNLCVIDGIVGAAAFEWGGAPVAAGVLLAGNDALATDALAARFMGVDPGAPRGTPPFINAENHRRLCAEDGLGSIAKEACTLDGDMPDLRCIFFPAGAAEPGFIARMQENGSW